MNTVHGQKNIKIMQINGANQQSCTKPQRIQ